MEAGFFFFRDTYSFINIKEKNRKDTDRKPERKAGKSRDIRTKNQKQVGAKKIRGTSKPN